jgi:hypothetical protein
MSKTKVEPDYMSEEEINRRIGKVLWGKEAEPFSMGKLIRKFIIKRIVSFFKR